MIPDGECPTSVDGTVMVSLESDAAEADIDYMYTSRLDSQLAREPTCSDSGRCSSGALEVQPSRPASPSSSGSIAPTSESTVVESTSLIYAGQLHSFDIGMLDNETPSPEQVRTAGRGAIKDILSFSLLIIRVVIAHVPCCIHN